MKFQGAIDCKYKQLGALIVYKLYYQNINRAQASKLILCINKITYNKYNTNLNILL